MPSGQISRIQAAWCLEDGFAYFAASESQVEGSSRGQGLKQWEDHTRHSSTAHPLAPRLRTPCSIGSSRAPAASPGGGCVSSCTCMDIVQMANGWETHCNIITCTVLGAPYYNYSIMGPKILFNEDLRAVAKQSPPQSVPEAANVTTLCSLSECLGPLLLHKLPKLVHPSSRTQPLDADRPSIFENAAFSRCKLEQNCKENTGTRHGKCMRLGRTCSRDLTPSTKRVITPSTNRVTFPSHATVTVSPIQLDLEPKTVEARIGLNPQNPNPKR